MNQDKNDKNEKVIKKLDLENFDFSNKKKKINR